MRALRDFLLSRDAATAGGREAEPLTVATAASPAVGAPPAVAVLCGGVDARALGVAAATLLARRHRVACGLACIWTPDELDRPGTSWRPPAGRAARRLAAALDARSVDTTACGRVAVAALPADPVAAAAAMGRAVAAAGPAPAVLVLGGPRGDAFDPLLADFDRILVIARGDADPALTSLAVAGLGPLADRATAVTVSVGPATRALAGAGLAIPPALRRALAGGGEAR